MHFRSYTGPFSRDNSIALVALMWDAYYLFQLGVGVDFSRFARGLAVINVSDDHMIDHSIDPQVFNADSRGLLEGQARG